jgi:hypothetical protein
MCEDFAQNFGDKRTGCCITTTQRLTLPFYREIFYQKQHNCRPPPTPLFSVPPVKIKLKGRHFDTTEVLEAESQAVLNSLTEHDFQDAFKNGTSAGNGAYARKGTTSRLMVVSRPKVGFRPDVSKSPGYYG